MDKIINDNKFWPRFSHDCSSCTFLGQYNEFDLYFHPDKTGGEPTVICRWGSEGHQYSSGLVFAVIDSAKPHYVEAIKRAMRSSPENMKMIKNYFSWAESGDRLKNFVKMVKEIEDEGKKVINESC